MLGHVGLGAGASPRVTGMDASSLAVLCGRWHTCVSATMIRAGRVRGQAHMMSCKQLPQAAVLFSVSWASTNFKLPLLNREGRSQLFLMLLQGLSQQNYL